MALLYWDWLYIGERFGENGIFGDFSGWVGAEREKAFRVKAVGTV
jgi:hypothetical protein